MPLNIPSLRKLSFVKRNHGIGSSSEPRVRPMNVRTIATSSQFPLVSLAFWPEVTQNIYTVFALGGISPLDQVSLLALFDSAGRAQLVVIQINLDGIFPFASFQARKMRRRG